MRFIVLPLFPLVLSSSMYPFPFPAALSPVTLCLLDKHTASCCEAAPAAGGCAHAFIHALHNGALGL